MSGTVINISRSPDFNPENNPGDVYIGRYNRRYGLKASKWSNPYRIGKDGTREAVIEKYRRHLDTSGLINQIEELRGKRLGCWCKPAPCHGDVLIELLEARGPATKYAAVPGSMKQAPRWVVWQYEIREGKKTKVLHTPGRGQAKSIDPATWVTFEEAIRSEPFYSGIGFVLGGGWLGLDADHVRDPKTGEWAPGILDEIKSVQSYAEVSPSGSGAHVIAFGTKPGDRSRAAGEVWEMYDRGRFFTVTADHIPGTPDEVQEPAPGSLEAIYAKFGTSKEQGGDRDNQYTEPKGNNCPLPNTADLTDAEIVEKCQNAANAAKFNALWRGDIAGYASHSEADLALCSIITFYTRDPAQLERLIRQSGLYREKWDRTDYVTRTIAKALQACRETWSPGLSSFSPEERYLRRVDYRRKMRAARQEVRG